MILQTPKATLEVKDLQVDIFRVGKSDPRVLFRLLLSPIVANLGEPQVSYDHSSSYSDGDGNSILASDQSTSLVNKPFSSFRCNELSVSCEFGHNRWMLFYSFSIRLFLIVVGIVFFLLFLYVCIEFVDLLMSGFLFGGYSCLHFYCQT